MQRFYGSPSDRRVVQYEREVVALLSGDYLDFVTYGFRRGGNQWVVALKYAARYGGVLVADDSPGKIPMGARIDNCAFYSFLCYNRKWSELTPRQQEQIYLDADIGFWRHEGEEPEGNWRSDKTYSAGGRGVLRHVIG